MNDSQELLRAYAANGSEPAFTELVQRYLNLVHSAALRLTGGNTHLADDVTQAVFADLARVARTLSKEVMIGGWLHRHTCFVAANLMRSSLQKRTKPGLSALQHPARAKQNSRNRTRPTYSIAFLRFRWRNSLKLYISLCLEKR